MRNPAVFVGALLLGVCLLLVGEVHRVPALSGGAPTINGLSLSMKAMTASVATPSKQPVPKAAKSVARPTLKAASVRSVAQALKVSAPQSYTMEAQSMTAQSMTSTYRPQQLVTNSALGQTMPSSPTTGTPGTPSAPTDTTPQPQVPQPVYAIVAERPDFSYNPAGLNFLEKPSSHTLGQHGMGVGPGLQVGVVRYVPVGEF